ncbi:MAG: SoxR reducing system RseC family protein [Peptoniphilus sp.]|nr:SoxR reducing system RseC family protein [Peptoniphilus sp.]MDY3119183.1 SoxR reducing system RseC family protein [Peptoniphilus sp.]
MIQIGHILSVKNGFAYMEVSRKGACGSGCATCTSSACESKSEFISIPNELNAEEGDSVELFVNDRFVLHSIYKLYGIPLVAFLLAVGLGQLVFPSVLAKRDIYIFALGALSLVISYFILRRVDKKHVNEARPKMIRIL